MTSKKKSTMDDEIGHGLHKEIDRLMDAYVDADWSKVKSEAEYIIKAMQTLINSTAMMKSAGIKKGNKPRIIYTGKRMGQMRIYKIETGDDVGGD